ncbi:MAG: DNA polymerase ligase N-terminal domain-containing protein [Candidatus Aenigmatarchaeota archaeon]
MPRFVIHNHHTRKLHYDLRLELDNILKSWAVPKEPPKQKGLKRLAIQVDDHDLNYIDFEGKIPEGFYGAGIVKIWDKGYFDLIERNKEKIVFRLNGKKLRGVYCLIRFETKEKNTWLFFKK